MFREEDRDPVPDTSQQEAVSVQGCGRQSGVSVQENTVEPGGEGRAEEMRLRANETDVSSGRGRRETENLLPGTDDTLPAADASTSLDAGPRAETVLPFDPGRAVPFRPPIVRSYREAIERSGETEDELSTESKSSGRAMQLFTTLKKRLLGFWIIRVD